MCPIRVSAGSGVCDDGVFAGNDDCDVRVSVVGEAFDGHHALATFHLHTPHLILMDFIMPKMNGIEAARHLTTRHPGVLILMVTADPSRELELEARRVGIRGLCEKKKIQCLIKAVQALMDGGTYFSENAAA